MCDDYEHQTKPNTESDYVSKMRYIASYFNARREVGGIIDAESVM